MVTRAKHPIGTKRRTGETCPESGIWKVEDPVNTTTGPFAEGNRFPPYKDKAVTWILIQYA